MKLRSFLSRHRLLINVLALVFATGVLVLPPAANAQEIILEELSRKGAKRLTRF